MTKIRINRFIVFLPILLFVSCLRICFDSEKDDTRNAISIEEAKSIFFSDLQKSFFGTRGLCIEQYYRDRWMLNLGEIRPKWYCEPISYDEAFDKLTKSDCVSFEIESQDDFCVLEINSDTGEERYAHCDTRLFIIRGDSNLNRSFILFFIPSQEFFHKVDYDYCQIDTYGIIDYSGIIIVTNLDGNIICGHCYENGELITSINMLEANNEDELLELWYGIEDLTKSLVFIKSKRESPLTKGIFYNANESNDDDNDDELFGGEDQDFIEEQVDGFSNYQGDYELDVSSCPFIYDYDYTLNYGQITPIEDTEILNESICIAYSSCMNPYYIFYDDSPESTDLELDESFDTEDMNELNYPDDINQAEENAPEPGETEEESYMVTNRFYVTIIGNDEQRGLIKRALEKIKSEKSGKKLYLACSKYGIMPKIIADTTTITSYETAKKIALSNLSKQEIIINTQYLAFTWPLFEELLHLLQHQYKPNISVGYYEFEARCLEAVLTYDNHNITSSHFRQSLSLYYNFFVEPNEDNFIKAREQMYNYDNYNRRTFQIEWNDNTTYFPTYELLK